MVFGDDGQLYLTLGDGASFTGADYGQRGGTVPDATTDHAHQPVRRPPDRHLASGVTPVVDVVSAEGGALRSQDLRTTGDPQSLIGTLLRIDPATGAASPDNPLAAAAR